MPTEDGESWKIFLRSLVERGLTGVKLIISGKHLGIRDAVKQIFNNGVLWQRCKVHTMRNILSRVNKSAKQEVANALKTIFAQASRKKAEADGAVEPGDAAKDSGRGSIPRGQFLPAVGGDDSSGAA